MLLACSDAGSGPVLVLLHGFPSNRTMWSAQLANLGAEYRVIALDLRGQGETPPPDGVYSMELMADDVLETLDELGLREPVVLSGLSMGGYVALAALAKAPRRFRGLILMDTRATPDTPEAAANREVLARQVEASGDIAAIVEGMTPRLFSPESRERRADMIDAARREMLATQPLGFIGALRGMAVRPDRTAELAAIPVPTLVLVGAEDVITPPDEMERMAAAIPFARFEVIPEAGHFAPMENAATCDAAILGFLHGLD